MICRSRFRVMWDNRKITSQIGKEPKLLTTYLHNPAGLLRAKSRARLAQRGSGALF